MIERQDNRTLVASDWWRALLLAVLLLAGLSLWDKNDGLVAPARAQLPNPASQRLEQLHVQRRTNELLEEILQLLKSGTLHVRLEGADNQADATGGSARTAP